MVRRLPYGSLPGKVIKKQKYEEFVLTEIKFSPFARLPDHVHEYPYFSLVLDGSYTEFSSDFSRTYKTPWLVFHPDRDVHSDSFHSAGARQLVIAMSPQWSQRVGAGLQIREGPHTYRGGTPVWIATRLYREFQRNDPFSCLSIEGLILELLAESCRQTPSTRGQSPPPWLEEVRERLLANFRKPVSATEIAASVGVHPVHLCRIFRKYYTSSLGECVRNARVEFASRKIAGGRTRLADIALEAGFYDQSHFTKIFKRSTGMTPAEFRAVSHRR